MLHGGGRLQHRGQCCSPSGSARMGGRHAIRPTRGRGPTERSLDRTRRRPHRERDRRPPSCPRRFAVACSVHRQGKIGEPVAPPPHAVDVHMRGAVGGARSPRTAFRCASASKAPASGAHSAATIIRRLPGAKTPRRLRSGNRSATDQRPACRVQADDCRARGRYRPRRSTPEKETSPPFTSRAPFDAVPGATTAPASIVVGPNRSVPRQGALLASTETRSPWPIEPSTTSTSASHSRGAGARVVACPSRSVPQRRSW